MASFLIPVMVAVLVPPVAVPVHEPVALADVDTGPGEPNCVLGRAATAGTESVGDATQSFFRAGQAWPLQ